MDASETTSKAIKAFMSYSWSSPTREAWVIALASRLVEDGINVVLDKWDLRPGHDAYAFMEGMVSDPDVSKVIMVCDKAYAEKADGRSGGVGAEAQIITPELYNNTKQDKYAAIVTELDENGKAYRPSFYGGRIYFDFTSSENDESSYEELLRWLLGKPRYIKPKLGQPPSSIVDPETSATTGTTSKLRRAESAIKQGSPAAAAATREFAEAVISEMSNRVPSFSDEEEADEIVLRSVEQLRPYVRQITDLTLIIARYDGVAAQRLLSLFEGLRNADVSWT
ncbi:MAG TPA: TIR domain-containing protein [Allosphingosinicella sp.]|jgi:hypothetical protein|uniref:TIR domain-containing protein n=1 Tax=Allosphingosinicella sp. TaxID=2823234 RepID=UPI002F29D45E